MGRGPGPLDPPQGSLGMGSSDVLSAAVTGTLYGGQMFPPRGSNWPSGGSGPTHGGAATVGPHTDHPLPTPHRPHPHPVDAPGEHRPPKGQTLESFRGVRGWGEIGLSRPGESPLPKVIKTAPPGAHWGLPGRPPLGLGDYPPAPKKSNPPIPTLTWPRVDHLASGQWWGARSRVGFGYRSPAASLRLVAPKP